MHAMDSIGVLRQGRKKVRRSREPTVRAAVLLWDCLQRRSRVRPGGYHGQLMQLSAEMQALVRDLRLLQRAQERRWAAATRHLGPRVHASLQRVRGSVDTLIAYRCGMSDAEAAVAPALPPLGELVLDLRQLDEEFAGQSGLSLKFSRNGGLTLSVDTRPVELEGVYLGPFRLTLDADRLLRRADTSAFEVEALDPNPAATDASVTHPHVRDGTLCAGEASAPLAAALSQGRFCDAFLAVAAVLHTYNAHSPYVSLEHWSGTPCGDCGAVVPDDEGCCCEACRRELCSQCTYSCGSCRQVCCRDCLLPDDAGEDYCPRCRRTCDACGGTVSASDHDADTGLCTACLEAQQEQEEQEQLELEEHEELTPQRDSDPLTTINPSETSDALNNFAEPDLIRADPGSPLLAASTGEAAGNHDTQAVVS